jgi:hypothetical protein
MDDERAKQQMHDALRFVRESLLAKLDGLDEYDVRRPLTATGTNLLGLVKHLALTEAWYFGEVFGRPFPEPWWDDGPADRDDAAKLTALFDHKLALVDMWVTEDESRADILDRYRRACEHADATIAALALDAPGHVPWWPRPNVTVLNILVHLLTETSRHAGHADILREELDGAVEQTQGRDAAFWDEHRAAIERAARAAGD